MPSYRIVTVGAPRQRKAYGGNVESNAVAYAPIQVHPPLGAFGGDEQTWGAPNRLVLGSDPRMANYLPGEQNPFALGRAGHCQPALYHTHFPGSRAIAQKDQP